MIKERPERWQLLEQRYIRSPMHDTLGLSLQISEVGVVAIHHDGNHRGMNGRGTPSGGLIAQMVDSSVMQAAITHLEEGDLATTLELKVNYVRSAEAGERLTGHGRVEFLGRTTAVGIGRVEDSVGRLLALGTLTVSIRRQRHASA